MKVPLEKFKTSFAHHDKNQSFKKVVQDLCIEEGGECEKKEEPKRPETRGLSSYKRRKPVKAEGDTEDQTDKSEKNKGETADGNKQQNQEEEEKKNENIKHWPLELSNTIQRKTQKTIRLKDHIDLTRVNSEINQNPKESPKHNPLNITDFKIDSSGISKPSESQFKSGKKSKPKEKANQPNINPFELRDSDPNYLMNFKPKALTLQIINMILEKIVRQVSEEVFSTSSPGSQDSSKENMETEGQKDSHLINYHILLKTIQLIVHRFPCLTPAVVRFNCSKYLKKKISAERPLGLINAAALSNSQGVNFLSFLVKVVSFYCVDKHRSLLFELCFDKHLLCELNKGGLVYYAFDVRKKILGDIFSILESDFNSSPSFYSNSLVIHNLIVYASLHHYLLPLREVARLSLRFEDTSAAFNFGKLYSDILKASKVDMYYFNEKILPFVLEPLSLLLQYSLFFAIDKVDEIK